MTISRGDARLVRALASAARHAPEKMHAGHLAEPAEDLAKRIERMTIEEETTGETIEA
jgi:hypothetical protein